MSVNSVPSRVHSVPSRVNSVPSRVHSAPPRDLDADQLHVREARALLSVVVYAQLSSARTTPPLSSAEPSAARGVPALR
eukprot:413304-Rhodomonas_salina.1